MNNIKQDATIGEVVVLIPEATQIFSEFGIDFCCGGHRLLSQVMKDQGIDERVVYDRLQDAVEKRKSSYDDKNYTKMSPAVLSAYIEDTHHGYLRKVLPEAAELLNTVLRVHGKNHRELFDLYRLFGQLKTDLEQHLLKEETILFPILDNAKDNRSEVISVTDEIINEHEAAGEILRELREVSNNYTLPEGACKTYEKTYSLLEEIEKDLHQHIHLENNILLKEYANR
ncbi:MAG: hypothetical protein K0S41_1364 [Anaerocolumna sp.]|jgi:regulator of cell morphogenesis and NO signaling|nr:hypothetical protein [Anaerocolumna sp.]